MSRSGTSGSYDRRQVEIESRETDREEGGGEGEGSGEEGRY